MDRCGNSILIWLYKSNMGFVLPTDLDHLDNDFQMKL